MNLTKQSTPTFPPCLLLLGWFLSMMALTHGVARLTLAPRGRYAHLSPAKSLKSYANQEEIYCEYIKLGDTQLSQILQQLENDFIGTNTEARRAADYDLHKIQLLVQDEDTSL